MNSRHFLNCVIIFLLSFHTFMPVFAQDEIYLDSTKTINERVEDLLSRMSLDEKIGQMTQVDRTALNNIDHIRLYFLGSILSGGGSVPEPNTVESWANMYDEFQQKALEAPLKIPLIYGVDAVHGHNNLLNSVIFPHNIGLGCANNPELTEEIARITAIEVSATGIDWNFSPCIAVAKDERWGRTYESFGETSELVSQLGDAAIRGYQGSDSLEKDNILACAKHFIGDGGTTDGIDQGNTELDEAELRRIHLPAYVSAINSGVGSIMASFSSWNGSKIHGNKYLLIDVLKTELGFEGIVISDWAAIDQLPGDYTSDVESSINAGIDMVMVPTDYVTFITTIKNLVINGNIPNDRIDDAVKRILKIKFMLGLFEKPLTDRSIFEKVGSVEHRAVARQAVKESLVLLKKKDDVLPIPNSATKILVAGSHANNLGYQCGGWTIEWQGKSGDLTEGTTILESLEMHSPNNQFIYSEKGLFTEEESDYSIVVIGEKPYAEGEGDKSDLAIQKSDVELIKKMKSISKRVIVILISGRPLIINSILHYSDAIIAAWLPGTEGDGITDILLGTDDPSGRLSMTWPKSMEQIPINYGDENYDPLYEYGFGITDLNNSETGSAPQYLSSIVTPEGDRIELSFNKKMSKPALLNSEFIFRKNQKVITPLYSLGIKEEDSTTIVITFNEIFVKEDTVSLEYISGNLSSIDGGVLESFVEKNVLNEVLKPAIIIPGKVEAENYSDMFGIQTEITSDIDGGLNVAFIDDGDWLEYRINPEYNGLYMMTLRVSSLSTAGNVTVTSNSLSLFSRSLPITGGWQEWTTISQLTGLFKGEQTIRITASKGGFNLNWISFDIITSSKEEKILPSEFSLSQNYPNPFNPETTFDFEIPRTSRVNITVYDILGRIVSVLVNEIKVAGKYNIKFNGSNISSGTYLVKMESGDFITHQKIKLLK